MNIYLTIAIIFVVSIVLILLGFKLLNEISKILKTGLETEGVIFELERSLTSGQTGSSINFPVVRFVTDKKVWVTKKSRIGTTGKYKPGQKVIVVYQQEQPDNFFIKDWVTNFVPRAFIVAGVILFLIGLYKIYQSDISPL